MAKKAGKAGSGKGAARAGVLVCAHPKWGYFLPVKPEEVAETLEFLHKRALHSLKLYSEMKRIPLGELMGQMQLELTEEDYEADQAAGTYPAT